ncbi:MAG: R3H domain-containing nucleic acid-binding protein, partial [Terracidiphilus sp.]
ELRMTAETAADKVIRTGVPYAFPAMNSRERRLLHMAFRDIEGVETASNGEGQDRFLAVYPEGKTHLPVAAPVKPRSFGDHGRDSRDRGRGSRDRGRPRR